MRECEFISRNHNASDAGAGCFMGVIRKELTRSVETLQERMLRSRSSF